MRKILGVLLLYYVWKRNQAKNNIAPPPDEPVKALPAPQPKQLPSGAAQSIDDGQ